MANNLRIVVAHKTDVGRKRERNQDNVAHFIPADEDTLNKRGAFFVVCDGMGGHAAGEVASEIGVNTLRDAYFASKEGDVITALAGAVDQANARIYNHGKEHPELSGMGTTCVSLVLDDGRAFIVNIGDSRAYIVRNGEMRQVTQDHSWVAEQVRYGLLTEEQARSHSHRNVITRSLGTQPAVTADLFIETLHNGDRILLCSDGLHGYVEEADIAHELLANQSPEDSARKLVGMANDAGGPDNITALIVHVLEVAPPEAQLKLPGSNAPAEEGVTQPLPVVTAEPAAAASKPAKVAPVSRTRKRRRNATLVRRTLELVALLAIATGVWYYFYGPIAVQHAATARVKADVASTMQAVTQAPNQDSGSALTALAKQRTLLLTDVNDKNADAASVALARAELNGDLATAIKQTAQRYQDSGKFKSLDSGTFLVWDTSASCIAPGASAAAPLANVTAVAALPASLPPTQPKQPAPTNGTLPIFVVNGGVLYWLNIPTDAQLNPIGGAPTCVAVPIANVQTVLGVASQGSALLALVQGSDGSYTVQTVTFQVPPAGGAPTIQVQPRFGIPVTGGQKPLSVTADGGAVYIGFSGGSTGTPGMWTFSGDTSKGPASTAKFAHDPTALAAAPGGALALLSDGELAFSTPSNSQAVTAPAPLPILPLDVPNGYSIATPVPMPTPAASQGGPFGAGTSLAASGATVVISDSANNRIIKLGSAGANLTLGTQYLPTAAFTDAYHMTIITPNDHLLALIWNAGKLVAAPLG